MGKIKAGLLNNSLTVSWSIIENCFVSKEVRDTIIIICDVAFGAELFTKQLPSLEYCKDITAVNVRNCWEKEWLVKWNVRKWWRLNWKNIHSFFLSLCFSSFVHYIQIIKNYKFLKVNYYEVIYEIIATAVKSLVMFSIFQFVLRVSSDRSVSKNVVYR